MLGSETADPPGGRTVEPGPEGRGRRGRPRRRLWVLLGGLAVLAVGAAGGVTLMQSGEGTAARTSSKLPTATVTRTDMASTTEVDGKLGYKGSHTVLGSGGGRITWLPGTGRKIERGDRVYGLNGHSVPLFYGKAPLWRELKSGVSKGSDVRMVERNLNALGHNNGYMTVDNTFTSSTAAAIRSWQKDLGVTRTGTIKPGDVVTMRGAIRVSKVTTVLGADAGGTILEASGTTRIITVKVPVTDQGIVREGAEVRVRLPGGKTATGRVSSVGKVATAGSTDSTAQTGQGTETATIPVYVTLDGGGDGDFDGAPATVGFISTKHEDVLAVPITALLASADGTYKVNVVDASGKVRGVPVKLGVFDGDRVEVKGSLRPGMKVQVPES